MHNTPARPDDVDLSLDELVAAGFLVRYREPTRSNYKRTLRQWFEWCAQRGITPLRATRAHIEVYARELEELHHLKVSTVAAKLNAICGFYKTAWLDKHIDDNIAEQVRRPSVPRVSMRESLTRAEALQCLDIAERTGRSADHALWCLLVFNGLRIGEALALDVSDLGRQGGYRTIKVKREKGNRSAQIPMAARTSWAFDRMLGSRTSGPLFVVRTGERMDRKAADRIIKRVIKAAGITKNITPHSLRHTHVTLSLHAGVTVRDLTNSMGYSDSRQISYYDRDKDSLPRNATHLVSAYIEGA